MNGVAATYPPRPTLKGDDGGGCGDDDGLCMRMSCRFVCRWLAQAVLNPPFGFESMAPKKKTLDQLGGVVPKRDGWRAQMQLSADSKPKGPTRLSEAAALADLAAMRAAPSREDVPRIVQDLHATAERPDPRHADRVAGAPAASRPGAERSRNKGVSPAEKTQARHSQEQECQRNAPGQAANAALSPGHTTPSKRMRSKATPPTSFSDHVYRGITPPFHSHTKSATYAEI